jgi:hypothetical protein
VKKPAKRKARNVGRPSLRQQLIVCAVAEQIRAADKVRDVKKPNKSHATTIAFQNLTDRLFHGIGQLICAHRGKDRTQLLRRITDELDGKVGKLPRGYVVDELLKAIQAYQDAKSALRDAGIRREPTRSEAYRRFTGNMTILTFGRTLTACDYTFHRGNAPRRRKRKRRPPTLVGVNTSGWNSR